MAKRFFKLIYIVALLSICLSLPVYLLNNIRFDQVVITSYKAKCLSNEKYVVLQGDSNAYIFDEIILKDKTFSDTPQLLNFYCQYYDEIQPHILSYLNSKTNLETVEANKKFFAFKDRIISNVYSYPALYKLEIDSKETNLYEVYGPVVGWLIRAALVFILLQILKFSYTYIVFGEIVWHPFRQRKIK